MLGKIGVGDLVVELMALKRSAYRSSTDEKVELLVRALNQIQIPYNAAGKDDPRPIENRDMMPKAPSDLQLLESEQ